MASTRFTSTTLQSMMADDPETSHILSISHQSKSQHDTRTIDYTHSTLDSSDVTFSEGNAPSTSHDSCSEHFPFNSKDDSNFRSHGIKCWPCCECGMGPMVVRGSDSCHECGHYLCNYCEVYSSKR